MDALQVGNRWKVVDNMRLSELLLIHRFDDKIKRLSWAYVDGSGENTGNLPPHDEPLSPDPVHIPSSSGLIYVSTRGLSIFDLITGETRLLRAIDWRTYSVQNIWLSPHAPEIYYLQNIMSPTMYEASSKSIKKDGTTYTTINEEASLHTCSLDGDTHQLVADFHEAISSADIDWEKKKLIASIGTRGLIETDLIGGKISALLITKTHIGASLAPGNRVIRWNVSGAGPIEDIEGVSKTSLAESGRFPSFSSNGAMAFIKKTNELWLRDQDGDVQMIAALPPSPNEEVDSATWCPCGVHFAFNFTSHNAAGTKRKILAVANISDKELLLSPQSSASSARAWIPKKALQGGAT